MMEATAEINSTPRSRPRSGYARLRYRHQDLIAAHDDLKAEHEALQVSVDRLLAEHQRLMQAVKTPSWFEGANKVLAELEANPDTRALQVLAAALAQLQQRLAVIVTRQAL